MYKLWTDVVLNLEFLWGGGGGGGGGGIIGHSITQRATIAKYKDIRKGCATDVGA